MNKVILIGRLGKDPESRGSQGGSTICKFSLATDDGWGENQKTNWHRITTFGKTAENCAKYLEKGRQVAVEGRVDYSEYEKDGQKRYGTEIIADRVTFLGGRQDAGQEPMGQPDRPDSGDDDDDLPF